MNYIISVLFILITSCSFSQSNESSLDSLKREWKTELTDFTANNPAYFAPLDEYSSFADSVYTMFQKDTFIVETIYARQLTYDGSTMGLNQSSIACEKEYELLLNKYYQLLLAKLSKEDRKILIADQKAWLKFREQDRKLNTLIIKEKYSGGGTIQLLIHSSQYMYITKSRVNELVQYLIRMV